MSKNNVRSRRLEARIESSPAPNAATIMSERVSAVSDDPHQNPSSSAAAATATHFFLKILFFESLKIFPRNKHLFLPIFSLLTLPLSLLLFSLTLSSSPLKSQILRFESLARLAHTRFEARHVWQESRADALFLFRLKLLYFFPSYLLSLLIAVSSVVSTESTYSRKPLSLKAAFASVKHMWTRPAITSIYIYISLSLYAAVPATLAAIIGGNSPLLRLLIWVIGWVVEVYIMAVMNMGLVVSIVENRFGWEAIRVGSDLMEGRRVCGWVLSGLLASMTGWIRGKMEAVVTDGADSWGEWKWTPEAVVAGWDRVGLVAAYATVVMWGFVITTVFYCECKKRHVLMEERGVDGGIDF